MFGMLSASGYINKRTQECFEAALVAMARERLNDGRSKYRLRKSVDQATNIFAGRNWHCQYMLDNCCEYLMMIDSDMTFDSGAVMKLISADKDVVSGLAFIKTPPYSPVMGMRTHADRDFSSYKTIINWVDNALIQVDGIGTAFLLIKRKVLETIEGPWFCHIPNIDAIKLFASQQLVNQIRTNEDVLLTLKEYDKIVDGAYDNQEKVKQQKISEGKNYKGPPVIGSDYYFCNKVIRAGFEIWVDTSIKLGHIGEAEYDIDDYKSWGGPVKDKPTQKDVSTDYDTIADFARKSNDARRTA